MPRQARLDSPGTLHEKGGRSGNFALYILTMFC
jgi:hypothetical protein